MHPLHLKWNEISKKRSIVNTILYSRRVCDLSGDNIKQLLSTKWTVKQPILAHSFGLKGILHSIYDQYLSFYDQILVDHFLMINWSIWTGQEDEGKILYIYLGKTAITTHFTTRICHFTTKFARPIFCPPNCIGWSLS